MWYRYITTMKNYTFFFLPPTWLLCWFVDSIKQIMKNTTEISRSQLNWIDLASQKVNDSSVNERQFSRNSIDITHFDHWMQQNALNMGISLTDLLTHPNSWRIFRSQFRNWIFFSRRNIRLKRKMIRWKDDEWMHSEINEWMNLGMR